MVVATSCPYVASAGVELAFVAARRAKQGIWPVAGGWLNQTQKCLDAVEYVELQERLLKPRKD